MANGSEMSNKDTIDQASEEDRVWFEAHPTRSHRVRPFIPGETPEADPIPPTHVAVRQVKPGIRVRLPLWLEGEPGPGEFAARRLFELAMGPPNSQAHEFMKVVEGVAK
jgi:hypothetical protein